MKEEILKVAREKDISDTVAESLAEGLSEKGYILAKSSQPSTLVTQPAAGSSTEVKESGKKS